MPTSTSGRPAAKSAGGNGTLHPVQAMQLFVSVASEMFSRQIMQTRVGVSFDGLRDTYEALGYKRSLDFRDFWEAYQREPIAGAAIDRLVDECWAEPPQITESEEDETPFETSWKEVEKSVGLYGYMERTDRLSIIGRYAILLLGFDDGGSLDQPVSKARKLIYACPYSEGTAEIKTFDDDTKSPRYGQPLLYQVDMKQAAGGNQARPVHFSRVIHVPADPLESDVLGVPILGRIFNNIFQMALVGGGSAEMFWRGARRAVGLSGKEGFDWDDASVKKLQDQIDGFVHKMQDWFVAQGVDITQLAPQVSSPKDHSDLIFTQVSVGLDIPKRVFMGSEQGELASSQDARRWQRKIKSRQNRRCDPRIVRPTINRLIDYGVVAAPKTEYGMTWPPIQQADPKEDAEVASALALAIKNYTDAVAAGAEDIIPIEVFLSNVLHLSEEVLRRIDSIKAAGFSQARSDRMEVVSGEQG